MGILEEKNKRRRRKESLKTILFTSLAIVGTIALGGGAQLASNILREIKKPKKRFSNNVIRQSVFRLKKEGLIFIEETPRGKFLRLTSKGEVYFKELQLKENFRKKPKKWDKRWRLVIFDISEKKGYLRKKFRLLIQEFGFYRLQDSVWVYPYDCEDFLTLAKAQLKIGREILYMIVEVMEGDQNLRTYFKLEPQ